MHGFSEFPHEYLESPQTPGLSPGRTNLLVSPKERSLSFFAQNSRPLVLALSSQLPLASLPYRSGSGFNPTFFPLPQSVKIPLLSQRSTICFKVCFCYFCGSSLPISEDSSFYKGGSLHTAKNRIVGFSPYYQIIEDRGFSFCCF